MHPQRLAQILREADVGDPIPIRFLELAETIEERDLHYVGVLGTRRRAVTQLTSRSRQPPTIRRTRRSPRVLRDWLDRDELADELFHILDCIGKGYSATEIIWDTSEGQWSIARLEHRDPAGSTLTGPT